jgi:hypothetical protein
MAECMRVWVSVVAQERMGKHKSVESTWKPQNQQFQGLATSVKCGLGAKQLTALNAVTILNNQK